MSNKPDAEDLEELQDFSPYDPTNVIENCNIFIWDTFRMIQHKVLEVTRKNERFISAVAALNLDFCASADLGELSEKRVTITAESNIYVFNKCSMGGCVLGENDPDELINPSFDENGDPICDDCFDDHYCYTCPCCEEIVEKEGRGNVGTLIVVVEPEDDEEYGPRTGVYEVLELPFYYTDYFSWNLYEGATKKLTNEIFDAEESAPLCEDCEKGIRWALKEGRTEQIQEGSIVFLDGVVVGRFYGYTVYQQVKDGKQLSPTITACEGNPPWLDVGKYRDWREVKQAIERDGDNLPHISEFSLNRLKAAVRLAEELVNNPYNPSQVESWKTTIENICAQLESELKPHE
jgi:hypothetical protein